MPSLKRSSGSRFFKIGNTLFLHSEDVVPHVHIPKSRKKIARYREFDFTPKPVSTIIPQHFVPLSPL